VFSDVLAVGAGGAAGALLRWLLSRVLPGLARGGFPWGTLLINLTGAWSLSWISAVGPRRLHLRKRELLALRVGVIGGYTTFSTFAVETIRLLAANNTGAAFLYLAASITGGIACSLLGSRMSGEVEHA